mmetsp:Transcript_58972/g.87565  ORF Transcript_58972/g.87565 Transcript_58972/m.87565 type:complete len:87 (+) Transcript_58972:76-336(+)
MRHTDGYKDNKKRNIVIIVNNVKHSQWCPASSFKYFPGSQINIFSPLLHDHTDTKDSQHANRYGSPHVRNGREVVISPLGKPKCPS